MNILGEKYIGYYSEVSRIDSSKVDAVISNKDTRLALEYTGNLLCMGSLRSNSSPEKRKSQYSGLPHNVLDRRQKIAVEGRFILADVKTLSPEQRSNISVDTLHSHGRGRGLTPA